jgi:predicted nucleic acid-binding protein
MTKYRIYLETSVISYLTARPSRDGVSAARQALTHDWWATVDQSQVWVSDLVLAEISRGDTQAVQRRQELIKQLPVLSAHADTASLANRLMQAGVVPRTEPEDAAHIALATLHGFRYLVTWNFAHFVGPDARYRVFVALHDWGYTPALFATPEELLEGDSSC